MQGRPIHQHQQPLHHDRHVANIGHGANIYLAPPTLPVLPPLDQNDLVHVAAGGGVGGGGAALGGPGPGPGPGVPRGVSAPAPIPVRVPAAATVPVPILHDNNPEEDDDDDDDKDGKGKHRSWEDNFAALVVYKEKFGDCFVPVGYPPDPTLGRWCAKLRKLRSTLKPERRARLEYLGFSFTNPKQAVEDKNWNENFDRLKEHYLAVSNASANSQHQHQHHPNGLLMMHPDTHPGGKAKLDPVLNRWVSRQRRNKKDGILTEERIQKLESIGFRWVLVEQKRKDYSKKDLHWIQQYNSLVAFQKQYGHTNPPHGKHSPYWQLAKWVARQRELFGQRRLLDDRKELLEALGFCWSMDDKTWNENFTRLVSHIQSYQHLDFQNDSSLGRWFYSQRVRHANGQMSEVRSRLFKSLGIEFEGSKATLKTGNETTNQGSNENENKNEQSANSTGEKKKSSKRKAENNTTTDPQQLLFTVDFPMKPPKGTKVRKKRFMDGWCIGEIIDVDQRDVADNRIKARVRYDDGMEEYMSDEECRISAIAYELHTTTPKLKLNLTARPQPPAKRKRGRPPSTGRAKSTSQSSKKKCSPKNTHGVAGNSKTKPETVGASSIATSISAVPNNMAGIPPESLLVNKGATWEA